MSGFCTELLMWQYGYLEVVAAVVAVVVERVLFRWHYRTAAAGPLYNINIVSL